MWESDRLGLENRNADGYYIPPTREQRLDIVTRAEAYEYWWVRLWHRVTGWTPESEL